LLSPLSPLTEQRAARTRELKLLEHAGPHLQRLIIAALETGCRRGELLSLRWRDVNLDRREMTIRSETTKTRTGRVIPVSASPGRPEDGADGPGGETFPPDRYVFGDAVGERVKDIKKAWETCILKAHGHAPAWHRNNTLTAASRAALRAAALTFHDLRHEACSRLLEAGWPLHNVAHMLGHSNIARARTSTPLG
jgi:integrase